MKKAIRLIAVIILTALSQVVSAQKVSFSATIYAVQSMSDNESPAYMINWATTNNGISIDKSKAGLSSVATTLTIDASAISGTISSISVYTNSHVAVTGELFYNGSTYTICNTGNTSIYNTGHSNVIRVEGSAKTCKAYLLPVALTGGVKVTVMTEDGNYYTQDFTDDIAAGANKTLTITNTTAGQLWMSTIPGKTYFSMLSTPGAHDAATSTLSGASQCQDMTIAQQLATGVRCFDLRPGYKYSSTITAENLYIYHSTGNTKVLYVDAIKTLVDFLKANPTEAITVTMVKEASSGSDRSSEMWSVINACHSEYTAYMKTLDHSYYTLDDFRGKICYINRNGTACTNTVQITNWPDDGSILDYKSAIGSTCYANIQDGYDRNGTTKQDSIKIMLGYSSSNTLKARFHFNFCSSAYQIFGKYPSGYAAQTNPVITTYLNDNNITGSTGYLYADYIGSSSNGGADLLKAIVNQNYKYVFKGMTYGENDNMDLSQSSNVAWTKTGTWTDAYGDATTKTYVTENYSGWDSQAQTEFSLTRQLYLPAGIYKLTGYGMYNGTVGSAKLIAKSASDILGSINILPGTLDSSTSGSGGSDDLRKAANAFANGVSLNTVYFVLTEPKSVTLGWEGTHTAYRQWFVCGPVTLTKIDRIEASEDVTSFITNPTVYNKTNTSCPSGWTAYVRTAGNGNYTTGTGDTQIENWHGTPANAKFDYYQTLTLPAGKYTLGAQMLYRNGDSDEVGIYAYDVATGTRVSKALETIDATLHDITLDFSASGGQVNIGIINLKTMTGDWVAADNFTLKYKGTESATRSTTTGKFGTICLPYASTATGATAYSAEISGNLVKLTEVGTNLEAGTPYIYKATANEQTFTDAGGLMVMTPSETTPLTGVFQQTTVPGSSYLLQTQDKVQAFYQVPSGNTTFKLGKYKAYLSASEASASKLSIRFVDDDTSTAISALNAIVEGTAKIYDIQGRQRPSLLKGINIINGVKVIVR